MPRPAGCSWIATRCLNRQAARARERNLSGLIHRLGFVQLDSVQTVERAHHMILHARRTSYRPPYLARELEQTRSLFEHWTHDAAAIPIEFLP